jgi:uncharacterized protein (TIGR02099 family)
MVATLKRRLRHLRRVLGYSLIILLILIAVLIGLLNQALPWVSTHPKQIQAWLSERIGEPVTFSKAKGEWTRRGPVFTLDDLQVGEGQQSLKVGRAHLLIAVYSGLLPGSPLTELKVGQLSLQLVQDQDERWSIKGLPGQAANSQVDPLDKLEGFGELQIEQAELSIEAPRHQVSLKIPRVDLRLRVSDKKIKAGLSAWADTNSAPLNAVFDLSRTGYDGKAWVGGKDLQMQAWSPLLKATGLSLKDGKGEANVWATLQQQRIVRLQATADVENIAILSSNLITLDKVKTISPDARYDRLELNAAWSQNKNGWQFYAPKLQFHRNQKIASLNGLVIAGGNEIILKAPNIDLQPAFALLSLTDQMSPGLREWMVQAAPNARLSQVDLRGSRDGPWVGAMLVKDLQIDSVGDRPGLRGLSGRLQMDGQGGVFSIQPTPIKFLWPTNFKQDIDITLEGNLAFWRDSGQWSLGSSSLKVRGPDIGFNTRFDMGFQGDGSAPTLDMALDLEPSTFAKAKKFWFLRTMSPNAIRWLNTALIKGDVLNGRIVVNGDLDDFPFRNKEGVFDARASVRQAVVKFHPEWPQANPLDVDVIFDGIGFSLAGTGGIDANKVTKVTGGIAEFKKPILNLDIESKTKAENLRQLILNSPLKKKYAQHLNAGKASGEAVATLNLKLSMREGLAKNTMSGNLLLKNASLSDSRWNIAFTGVNGNTKFTETGFATENLNVNFEKQPAIFNLNVGSFSGSAKHEAVASLQGKVSAENLVNRYQNLQWLKPYVAGSSEWLIKVDIPKENSSTVSQLTVSSNLVGTAISLPAPLNKNTAQAVPLKLSAALPIDQGQVQLQYGNILNMRAIQKTNQPLTGYLQFGGEAPSALPASGLVAKGKVETLDSASWMAFASSGDSGSSLNEVDIRADTLLFLEHPFANSHLILNKSGNNTRIKVEGEGIQGSVDVVAGPNKLVQGRFSKLYMASSTTLMSEMPAVATESNALRRDVAEVNPANIPPLKFLIDDLRIGKTQLGKADIVTTQLSNGMRIDRFNTKIKHMGIDATGDWLMTAGAARSNFKVNFNANSFGDVLNELGFVGMIKGGKSKASLNASWPGSPGSFSMAKLNGELRVDIGEGRLMDVEPGGSGRILGLISLAEIPRRLTLDFSDFFSKGFAFNEMKGNILFSNGMAETQNLRINGPAAEIKIVGAANAVNQTYDQRIEVLPKAGGILPAIGLITGGPAGAAMGAAAQAVLQKPLKQTARTVYHVTGPWKKPDVVVVEKGPAKSTANSTTQTEKATEMPINNPN